MSAPSIQTVPGGSGWDDAVNAMGGHPLQLTAWGDLKAAHGWRVHRLTVRDGDDVIGLASVLVRPLPFPLRALAYVPRGPVVADLANAEAVTKAVAGWAKTTQHAVALTIEPDWTKGDVDPAGWDGVRPARTTILYPKTLILDLTKGMDDLLKAAHKNTRYYIRKAAKDGVDIHRVTTDAELEKVLDVYHATGDRAGFELHSDGYYRDLFRLAGDTNALYAAFRGEDAVAFIWTIASSTTGFELYGGVNDEGQQMRVNHALKWAVVTEVARRGGTRYDMNGLLNDGITAFKQSFAPGQEDHLVGSFDVPLSPLYPVWDRGLPMAKKLVRSVAKLRRSRT